MKKSLIIPAWTGTMFIIWAIYIKKFFDFYNDAIGLTVGEHSSVIQFIIMYQYREKEIMLYTLLAFLLSFVHLFLVFFIYYRIKNSLVVDKSKTIEFIVNLLGLLIVLFLLLKTSMYIMFIPIFILSLVIVYLAYLIAKMKYGKLIAIKENIMGVHGPFIDKLSAEKFVEELDLKDSEMKAINRNIYEENNQYFVEYL